MILYPLSAHLEGLELKHKSHSGKTLKCGEPGLVDRVLALHAGS